MEFWYILTATVCFIALPIEYLKERNSRTLKYLSFILFVIVAFVLAFISGTRGNNIGDTYYYKVAYSYAQNSLLSYFENITSFRDWGFTFILVLIKQTFGSDPQIFILIFSFLTIFPLIYVLYKYSRYFALSLYLFVTAGLYVSTMNGLRQYFVSAILLLTFPLIEKQRKFEYFLLILVLAQIHSSAWLFVPIYFIINIKNIKKIDVIVLFSGLLLFILYPVVSSIITFLINQTPYAVYGTDLMQTSSGSTLVRMIVSSIPVIIAISSKEKIMKHEKYFTTIYTMSILNGLVFLFSMNTWIYARIGIYTMIYSVILLTWDIKYIIKPKDRLLVSFIAIVLYGIFFYYEMVVSFGGLTYISQYF